MIRSIAFFIALLAATAACSVKPGPTQEKPAGAEPDGAPPAATVPQSEVRLLLSRFVPQEFKIYIARPAVFGTADPPGAKYPVIYALDANGEFGTVTETVRFGAFGGQEIPRALVVGIGYPVEVMEQTFNLRTRDYTPTKDTVHQRYVAARSGTGEEPATGGAEAFLRFVRQELKPFIEKNYPADPSDATIFGHSLGGLFASYALLHHPETFQRYVIASPSLWWDRQVSFEFEKRYAAEHKDLPATVFLSVGGLETAADLRKSLLNYPDQLRKATEEHYGNVGWPEMVELMERFGKTLAARKYPGLKISSYVFPDETHSSVLPMIASRGLRIVFRN